MSQHYHFLKITIGLFSVSAIAEKSLLKSSFVESPEIDSFKSSFVAKTSINFWISSFVSILLI